MKQYAKSIKITHDTDFSKTGDFLTHELTSPDINTETILALVDSSGINLDHHKAKIFDALAKKPSTLTTEMATSLKARGLDFRCEGATKLMSSCCGLLAQSPDQVVILLQNGASAFDKKGRINRDLIFELQSLDTKVEIISTLLNSQEFMDKLTEDNVRPLLKAAKQDGNEEIDKLLQDKLPATILPKREGFVEKELAARSTNPTISRPKSGSFVERISVEDDVTKTISDS